MANLGANFYPKLVNISSELGMKPEDLLAVMVSESGINPSAHEKTFNGAGLLGFMPSTLKGLGFKGNWQDFANLQGEDQLDYVKKLVQNNMQTNGGKPFSSAAQYYTANLWPIALKLPGIQEEDPNTAFIEANPETVTDPKTGQKYSKKYYELGYKITPAYEAAAYKYNPLFHGSTPGAITYGDMIKQVEKNKNNPIYKQALIAMNQATGYTPSKEPAKESDTEQEVAQTDGGDIVDRVENIMSKFLSSLAAKHNRQVFITKRALKQLPSSTYLISINSTNYSNSMEFARILCLALDEELYTTGTIHTDYNNVEVECQLAASHTKQLDDLVAKVEREFSGAIKKLGTTSMAIKIMPQTHSIYQECSIKVAEMSYILFHNQFENLNGKR